MIAFLKWLRSILVAVLNGFAKFLLALILIFAVLVVIGLIRGDGRPNSMVLTLDLRQPIADSAAGPSLPFIGAHGATMMDILFALDAAGHDRRVKGLVVRLGGGALSIAQAEEIDAALQRFRAQGKLVIAQASAFFGAGMGDYLAASAADQIWVQPKSDFGVAGAGAGEIFLRGLFDKIHAEPQIAKRAEYKSAADMYMEKTMTGPDREQLTEVMQSWYQAAVTAAATDRHLSAEAVKAAFEASPQFSEDAKQKGLIDRLGYDDDALAEAVRHGGAGTKPFKLEDYAKGVTMPASANIAVIEAAGDIVDGTARDDPFSGSAGIASDDLSEAIGQAAREPGIKAIVLRVDSPGGSVTASDQILHAVKKAQAAGKKVVVSMATYAASGGYYISSSADKIVAEPGTLTGSIGVLTGKVSVGQSLAMVGVGFDQVAIGKNTLMDSALTPYTPDQWAALNHTADVIYDDFLQKVAAGRKLPLEQVSSLAKGRVWTGADAKARGLVDGLGGFWTAAGLAGQLGGVPQGQIAFKVFPRRKTLWEGLGALVGQTSASARALEGLEAVMALPGIRNVLAALSEAPRGAVELRATGLPQDK